MCFNSFTDFRMQPFLNIRLHCQGIGGHRYCCASGVKSGQQEEHTLRWWSVTWDWCYFGPWANMNQITCAATISSISDSSQFEFPPSTDSLMDSNAKVMKSSTSWNQSNNLSVSEVILSDHYSWVAFPLCNHLSRHLLKKTNLFCLKGFFRPKLEDKWECN